MSSFYRLFNYLPLSNRLKAYSISWIYSRPIFKALFQTRIFKLNQPIKHISKKYLIYTPLARGFCTNTIAKEKDVIDNIKSGPVKQSTITFEKARPRLWTRIRNKVKLILMRQSRPLTMDDFMAFFSWLFLSHTVFILVGTTTFFSLVLALANSFQFQEFIRKSLSKLITKQLGMEVTLGKAIVPNWKQGKISFNQVKIQYNVTENEGDELPFPETPEVWDLTFDNIDITLSLVRWLDGKGIIMDCVLKGIRGVIDRSKVVYPADQVFDPKKARQIHQNDELELNSLIVEDCLLTICHPYGFRPFQVSIFNANFPLLRRRWLLYDVMCANSIVGMFDNCLFSVHMAQNDTEPTSYSQSYFKKSHFRIDGVPIDQFNGGVEGPFGWITSGTVDFDIDFMMPQFGNHDLISIVTNDLLIKFDEMVAKNCENLADELPQHFPPLKSFINTVRGSADNSLLRVQKRLDSIKRLDSLIFDCKIKFHNIKAGIPYGAQEISLASQAFVRPVVAYMNSNRTLIPIQCRLITDLAKFDGAWSVYDSELAYDLSAEVSNELGNLVQDERERNRRLKRVGLWGLQSLARSLINLIEYARGVRGFWHYLGTAHELKHFNITY